MKNSIEYRVDYETGTIVVTKKFAKAAGILNTPEYKTMRQLRKDNPDYPVVLREIKKNDGKKTYKNLTYKAMETYIILKYGEDSDERKAYNQTKALSEVQNGPYAYVKNWFLKSFPDYDSVDAA